MTMDINTTITYEGKSQLVLNCKYYGNMLTNFTANHIYIKYITSSQFNYVKINFHYKVQEVAVSCLKLIMKAGMQKMEV